MDPSQIYANICNLKMLFGKNFICPATLQKIEFMFPTLFMKYSLDLGKLSFSVNWLLGGLLKALFTAVATMLENLRALIMPFVDCTINVIKSIAGYIKAVGFSGSSANIGS